MMLDGMADSPDAARKNTLPYQEPAPKRVSGEVQLRCHSWGQVQALCADVDEDCTVTVPLTFDTGYVQLSVELPDGETVELRAHITGTTLDADGAPTGLILQPRPTYQMRSDLELAKRRVVAPHRDSERMEALADEASWTPRTSGISPRGEAGRTPDEAHGSKRPTVPPPDKKT